jgi:hypothetical protein
MKELEESKYTAKTSNDENSLSDIFLKAIGWAMFFGIAYIIIKGIFKAAMWALS